MSLHNTFVLCSLMSAAALFVLVEGTRFGRNEARCMVICSNRDSEECRMCNSRIPMRFGKRSGAGKGPGAAYLYDLAGSGKPDVRLLAVIPGRDDFEEESDDSYEEEK